MMRRATSLPEVGNSVKMVPFEEIKTRESRLPMEPLPPSLSPPNSLFPRFNSKLIPNQNNTNNTNTDTSITLLSNIKRNKEGKLNIDDLLDRSEEVSSLRKQNDDIVNQVDSIKNKQQEVARRLHEINKENVLNADKRLELERALFMAQKRNLLNEVLNRKLEVSQLEDKLHRLEDSQKNLLYKAITVEDMINNKDKRFDEEEVKERTNEWTNKYEDIINEIDDKEGNLQRDIVEILTSTAMDDVEIQRELSDHILSCMQKSHTKAMNDLLDDRERLVDERFVLTDRLDKVRSHLMDEEKWQKEEQESVAETLKSVDNAEQIVAKVKKTAIDKIKEMEIERGWLKGGPDSSVWDEMTNRYEQIQASSDIIQEENESLQNFFDRVREFEALKEPDRLQEAEQRAQVRVVSLLIDDIITKMVREVVEECTGIIKAIKTDLYMTLIKAITGNADETMRLADPTGKLFLYGGSLQDLAFEERRQEKLAQNNNYISIISNDNDMNNIHVRDTHEILHQPACVIITQPMADCVDLTPTPRSRFDVSIDRTLSPSATFMAPTDVTGRTALIDIEKQFWSALSLQLPGKHPSIFFSRSDPPILLHIICRPIIEVSILVVALRSGQLKLYRIFWRGTTSETILVGFTPKRKKKERQNIMQICESANATVIATLNDAGIVEVWSLNPIHNWQQNTRKFKKIPLFIAYPNPNDYVPQKPMTLLYSTDPWSLNLPEIAKAQNTSSERKAARLAAEQRQTGLRVTTICFHGSMTVLASQNSLMLGTECGKVYKINMDRVVDELDALLVNQPPFVSLEYYNPHDYQDGDTGEELLVQGDPRRAGNRVEREIFHYHTSPIVFIHVLYLVTQTIISVDSSGLLAVWSYDEDHFSPHCRFVPEHKMSLGDILSYYKDISPEETIDEPPLHIINKLKVWEEEHSDEISERLNDDMMMESFKRKLHKEIFKPILSTPNSPRDSNSSLQTKYTRYRYTTRDEDATTKWTSKSVRWMPCEGKVFKVLSSPEGEDIIIAFESNLNKTTKRYTLMVLQRSNKEMNKDKKSDYRWDYKAPFVQFDTVMKDEVIDIHIGPVIKETLTRFAFIYTIKEFIRVFSMDTGQEIEAGQEAFSGGGINWQWSNVSSTPVMDNHQRIFATISNNSRNPSVKLGSMRDKTLMNALKVHRRGGIIGGASGLSFSPRSNTHLREKNKVVIEAHSTDALKALRRDKEHQLKVAIESYQIGIISHDDDITSDYAMSEDDDNGINPPDLVLEILYEILDEDLWKDVEWRKEKRSLLLELYEEYPPYGVVNPTSWPSPSRHNQKAARSTTLDEMIRIGETEKNFNKLLLVNRHPSYGTTDPATLVNKLNISVDEDNNDENEDDTVTGSSMIGNGNSGISGGSTVKEKLIENEDELLNVGALQSLLANNTTIIPDSRIQPLPSSSEAIVEEAANLHLRKHLQEPLESLIEDNEDWNNDGENNEKFRSFASSKNEIINPPTVPLSKSLPKPLSLDLKDIDFDQMEMKKAMSVGPTNNTNHNRHPPRRTFS